MTDPLVPARVPVVLASASPARLGLLRQALIDYFDRELVSAELHVPYARQALRGEIYNQCQVVGEEFLEDGIPHLEMLRPAG